jgi:hypothetical protein
MFAHGYFPKLHEAPAEVKVVVVIVVFGLPSLGMLCLLGELAARHRRAAHEKDAG